MTISDQTIEQEIQAKGLTEAILKGKVASGGTLCAANALGVKE